MLFDKIIEKVPDYKEFLTVDELDASTKKLAQRFPGVVEVFEAGHSTKGHPIYCLKIGNGSKNALAFGCPHPNEPIGAMMLEYFSEALAENEELRKEMDFTWYIIKCSDPDGTKLNEGWFKGPFTIYNFARNYYRPAMNKQVEWTFPLKYKRLDFSSPIPETRALMGIMEDKKPEFIYSLHNGEFGGVYWYLSKELEKVYDRLPNIASKHGVPLSLGEPEVPYAKTLRPAIYKLINTRDVYDFYEKYISDEPEKIIGCGTSSDDYANRVGNAFTLVSELPYFYDPRIDDTSKADIVRREAILKSCDYMDELITFFNEGLEEIKDYLEEDNPFKQALKDFITVGGSESGAKRQWALANKELEEIAKVSEVFDNLYTSRFYHMLYLGLFIRMTDFELSKTKGNTEDRSEALLKVNQKSKAKLEQLNEILEKEMNYTSIPIQRLVRIQLESCLTTVDAIYNS